MRLLAIQTLIPLLLLCPILCGVGESDCVAHLLETGTDSSPSLAVDDCGMEERDTCPCDGAASCPQDTGDCLCMGAVQAYGVRTTDGDDSGLISSLDDFSHVEHSTLVLQRMSLAQSRVLSGGTTRSDERRLLAVLQVFRC